MKKTLTKFLAMGSIGLLMLSACKKDGTEVKSNGGKPGVLTASSTNLVLNKAMLNDTTKIINFNFTAPNYGYAAAVTNTLQIDAANDNWAHPTSATLNTKVLKQGYSTSDFNALVLKLNLTAGVASPIMARVMHTISADVAPVYSNVVNLTVTPFNLTSYLYVPGAYEGWANYAGTGGAQDSLVSVTGNGVYVGIINFTAGNNQFLIVPVKGDWTHKYATTDPAGSTSATVKYDGPNNFYAPAAAGQYLVTFDTNSNTISFALANTYSVTGDAALGWGIDTEMKYVNDGSSTWTVTTPLVSTGAFKIRQNDDWTYSWGVPKAGTPGAGIANTLNDVNNSNDNISVATSGTHTVTFTIPLTTVGTTPAVTANYTVN